MRTCAHVDMWTCGHSHMRTCRHVDMSTCRHAHTRTCRHADMRTCGHVHMSTCRHVDMSTCGQRHVDMRTSRPRVDPGSTPGRPKSIPGRPRATWVGPHLELFRGADFEVDLETIINGRSMPWSFGCTKRRPERMKLKQFYGFARFTRRGITKIRKFQKI